LVGEEDVPLSITRRPFREGEVARDREERRAQRRAVVYLGHEAAP